MKKNRKYVKEWLNTFVYIFGLVQIVFILTQFLPQQGIYARRIFTGINWQEIVASLISALVFSVSYFVINSDCLDDRVSLRKRIIYCSIPCSLTGLLLSYFFGLQNFIPHIPNKAVASIIWILTHLVSIGIYVGIFFIISTKHKKQSKRYNEALEKYKQES